MNVTARLRDAARDFPDRPALVCAAGVDGVSAGHVYSFRQLDRVVDAIALRALDWNIAPGEHVMLLIKRHLPMALLRLGLARAGVPTCNLPATRNAGGLVTLRESPRQGGRAFVAEPSWWTTESDTRAPMSAGGDALMSRQGTTGTSGEPKLVPMTHAMFEARWNRLHDAMPPPRDPRSMCTIAPGGGPALGYLLSTVELRGTVVVPDADADFLAIVERHRINMLVTNPYTVVAMMERLRPDAPPPPSLEQVVLTGGRLAAGMLKRVSARLCREVLCSYASTEAGLTAAGNASDMPDVDGATGFAMPGVDIEVVDDRGAPLPRGVTGEVRVRTPCMADRYDDNPAASERAFRDGWFYPGDVGFLTADGALVVAGRRDDLINVGGSKFPPDEIESVLKEVPGVRDAAAFGVPDAMGRQVIHAAIVADGTIDVAAIARAFERRPGVPRPQVVLRMPSLPRNDQDKLDRAKLARFAAAQAASAAAGT